MGRLRAPRAQTAQRRGSAVGGSPAGQPRNARGCTPESAGPSVRFGEVVPPLENPEPHLRGKGGIFARG